MHSAANVGYTLYMIVTDFSKKIIWFGTCFAFMYVLPYGFLHLTDLMALQSKIELNQRMSMGMEEQPQVQMRPF